MDSILIAPLVKLHFMLDRSSWHGTAVETVWTKRILIDDASHLYQLQNSPFYAFGLSYLDMVSAVETNGCLVFDSMVLRAGHSTYRLMVDWPSTPFAAAWDRLGHHGCTYESSDSRGSKLFAVDVPPQANIYDVYQILEDGESHSVWQFEEGHCGHVLHDGPK